MTIIATKIGNTTKYVSKVMKNLVGGTIFVFSDKQEDAHDFGSVLKASEAIEKHTNFHDRKFNIISNKKEAKKVSGAIFGIDKKLG